MILQLLCPGKLLGGVRSGVLPTGIGRLHSWCPPRLHVDPIQADQAEVNHQPLGGVADQGKHQETLLHAQLRILHCISYLPASRLSLLAVPLWHMPSLPTPLGATRPVPSCHKLAKCLAPYHTRLWGQLREAGSRRTIQQWCISEHESHPVEPTWRAWNHEYGVVEIGRGLVGGPGRPGAQQ